MPNDQNLDAAGDALASFAAGPVQSATSAIDSAVTKSFASIESTIARAVVNGKTSMDSLVNSILSSLDRIAQKDFLEQPIESLLGQVASSVLPIGGARAAGGPVDAGVPYLVGEQGPELFVPSGAGAIAPNGALGGGTAVTLNVSTPDAKSFVKSESQIAAMLSRALAKGQRNL